MMHLLAANRQLFPIKPWQGASSLVADSRVDCRPRRFPQCHRLPADIVAEHQAVISGSARHRPRLSGTLYGRGAEVVLSNLDTGGIGREVVQAMKAAGATVIATDLPNDADIAGAKHYLRHHVTSAKDWACIAAGSKRRC